ncbi:hypothetical protein K8352_18560 [Flavobacteriaceae bacterium F89]|uniref:Uncharacterized protein n=1 Tax=Cerina litoralis TaxID=2874477 RepID=A0AAE3EZZ0_9FLAO|nr:hypothetical protein [Cerina litoralis]MCG2462772.1 hypothetical protein [Cerina litoralis]
MIKVSAVLSASIVAVLIVSLFVMKQKEIKVPQLVDPVTAINILEECPFGDKEECQKLFGNLDYEVLDVKDIKVLENDEDIDLGFDVKNYLPENFNPYSTSGNLKMSSIDYGYLTTGTGGAPVSEDFVQIGGHSPVKVDDIVVLENDEDIELGFNAKEYLPRNFNPYASK